MCLKVSLVRSWGVEESLLAKLEETARAFGLKALWNRTCQAWMALGRALADTVGDGAQVVGCVSREVMQRQHKWEGWFQKPCVSQKQQGREERLGRAYCMLGFAQSGGSPGLARLHLDACGSVSRKAVGCCAS